MPKGLFTAIALSVAVLSHSPATAGPESDAEYIAAQTVTQELMSGIMVAFQPLIVGAMENNLRTAGIALSDPDLFARIVMEEFLNGYLDIMRAETANIYLEEFSSEELAGIAAFYASTAGQALVRATPNLAIKGAQIGQAVGQRAGLSMANRLAARMRDEGVVITLDPDKQDDLLRLLDDMARGI